MHFSLIYIPIIEIIIIAIIINWLLAFFWNTKTMDLLFGFIALLVIFAFASWFHLPVIQQILSHIISVVVLAVIIIFQPELRLALTKLSLKGKKHRTISEFDKFLDGLANTVYRFSEKRIGALILLENTDSLDEYANRAVLVNANFSPELLASIFMTTTPLHDGAVIIRSNTIVSAATILPLAQESTQLTKSMGTRHRAGLGLSQITDALIIVVSEETGKVSIARDGIMTRGVKIDRFKGIIRSIFSTPLTSKKSPSNPLKWLSR